MIRYFIKEIFYTTLTAIPPLFVYLLFIGRTNTLSFSYLFTHLVISVSLMHKKSASVKRVFSFITASFLIPFLLLYVIFVFMLLDLETFSFAETIRAFIGYLLFVFLSYAYLYLSLPLFQMNQKSSPPRNQSYFFLFSLSVLFSFYLLHMISSPSTLCENSLRQEIYSPDHTHKLLIFDQNCGATTAYTREVSLLSSQESLKNERGNI